MTVHTFTEATYTEPLHLITGVLLPIWDRIPGNPYVVDWLLRQFRPMSIAGLTQLVRQWLAA